MSGMVTMDPKLRELRCRVLDRLGIDVEALSAEQWLALALEAEDAKRICGPHDPAYEHFANQQRRFEEAAALAEINS